MRDDAPHYLVCEFSDFLFHARCFPLQYVRLCMVCFSQDASVVLLWCIGLSGIIPQAGNQPPLCLAQKTFARKIDHRVSISETLGCVIHI